MTGLILILVFRKSLRFSRRSLELTCRRTAPKLLNFGMIAAFLLSLGLIALYFLPYLIG